MTSDGPSTTGVVLAGGESSRFGDADKATATLDGRPLVARVVDRVAAATDAPPLVSVRTADQRAQVDSVVDRSVKFVDDASAFAGPLAGLVAAARAAETATLVVAGCDMPCLDPEALRWLVGEYYAAAPAVDGVVPVDDAERPQPLHALYTTAAIATLRAGDAPENRLRALLDQLRIRAVGPADAPATVSLSQSTTNVNTRQDLDALRATGDTDDVRGCPVS